MIKSASHTVNSNTVEMDILLKNGSSIFAVFDYQTNYEQACQTWEEEEYQGKRYIETIQLNDAISCHMYDEEDNEEVVNNADEKMSQVFNCGYSFDTDLDLSNWIK